MTQANHHMIMEREIMRNSMSISPCEKDGTKWCNKSLQILDPHPLNAQAWCAIKAPPKDTTPLPTVAGSLQGSSWLGCTNSDKFTAAFLARIRKYQNVLSSFVTPASAKGLSIQVCKACHWVCGAISVEALISKKRFEMLQRGGYGADMNHTPITPQCSIASERLRWWAPPAVWRHCHVSQVVKWCLASSSTYRRTVLAMASGRRIPVKRKRQVCKGIDKIKR